MWGPRKPPVRLSNRVDLIRRGENSDNGSPPDLQYFWKELL